jgi:hypothetical protein
MKKRAAKLSFSSALFLIPTELNLKQQYLNLSDKGKSELQRIKDS